MSEETTKLFELEVELPNQLLTARSKRLVGFKPRYERLRQDLRLLIDVEGLAAWSEKHYGQRVPLLDSLGDRYPLVVFHGDVGTGKSATAECIANELAREMGKDATLFKMSTRVRGGGNVGEMSALINQAFDVVGKTAGRAKLSILIIDEADSLATSRTAKQSHHEDKVAVNTLIQKIDDVRRYTGRVLVFLCTNHFEALDPAIVRRAAYNEKFVRPNDVERAELFDLDCRGLNLDPALVAELVALTGPNGARTLGFTYSDIRTRLLPEALGLAYPSRAITGDDLMKALSCIQPSPAIAHIGET